MSASSSLRVQHLDLNRDGWDNVPTLVLKSFQIMQHNVSAIKKWSDSQELRQLKVTEFHQQLEARLAGMDKSSTERRSMIQDLADKLAVTSEQLESQSNTFSSVLRQTLYGTRLLWEGFGKSFGVDLDINQQERELLTSGNLDLEQLDSLGRNCEDSVGKLTMFFDVWESWRTTADAERRSNRESIKDLSNSADRTRQRLLQWREMLKENARAVDILSGTIGSTQADVQDLQAVQVRQEDIDRTVKEASNSLEQLVGRVDTRLTAVKEHVETQVDENTQRVANLRQHTDERMEEHSQKVGVVLERSLSPVSAYLNTLGVKADALRSDVDRLLKDVPDVFSRLEVLREDLHQVDENSKSQASGLHDVIQDFAATNQQRGLNVDSRFTEVEDGIVGLRDAITTEVGGLSTKIRNTNDDIQSLRRGDLQNVIGDIVTLEQKVAKWIHAHPLPAKISEARLYALEARLAEETDARVKFEENLKAGVSVDPSPGLALPLLQSVPRPLGSAPEGYKRQPFNGVKLSARPSTRA